MSIATNEVESTPSHFIRNIVVEDRAQKKKPWPGAHALSA